MKKFFHSIKSSIYDREYYKSIDGQKTSNSFKYFLKINLLLTLITSLTLSFFIVPLLLVAIKPASIEKVVQVYPKDLEIIIKDGRASSNKTTSYSIPFDNESLNEKKVINNMPTDRPAPKNFITIDTVSDFTIEKFKSSDSLAYLSKEYLVYQEGNGQIKLQSLKSINNLTINQKNIVEWLGQILPYVKALIPFIFVAFFVMHFSASVVANLIFIFISSLIILIVEKIRKNDVPFKTIYKRGLHLVTAVMILNLVLFVFGFDSIWPVSLALFLWLYYSNIKSVVAK
jgi:hypothetical protein